MVFGYLKAWLTSYYNFRKHAVHLQDVSFNGLHCQDDMLDILRMRSDKTGCFIVMEDKGTNYRM